MTSLFIKADAALAGIPSGLRSPLLQEYLKATKNFRERRWEPAELNGGRLCEIVYCILNGYVKGEYLDAPTKPSNMLEACRSLEKATDAPRSVRIQIPRLLIGLYEIRNQRNVGHVGSDVDPSHMDASLVLAMVKWIMAELVRIYHSLKTDEAAAVVESLCTRNVPILWQVGDVTRVLADLSVKDRTLLLLYGSPSPLKVVDILRSLEDKNPSRFRANILRPAHKAALLHVDPRTDIVTLSPLGNAYVERSLALEVSI